MTSRFNELEARVTALEKKLSSSCWKERAASNEILRIALSLVGKGITAEALRGKQRNKPLMIVRRAIIIAGVRAGISFAELGRLLNRDHTTIMHHWRHSKGGRAEILAIQIQGRISNAN